MTQVSQTGRYASLSVVSRTLADGSTVLHRARRFLPGTAAARTTVVAERADRVDLIAARELGDASRWWSLCDANLIDTTDELEHEGRVVRIPVVAPHIGP